VGWGKGWGGEAGEAGEAGCIGYGGARVWGGMGE
jgi:hypothetical protein